MGARVSDPLLSVERLLDLYNEVYEEQFPYQRKPGRWIASSLGYCPRRQQFERGQVKSDRVFDLKTLRTFAWGRYLHTKVRNVFDKMGLLVAEEIALDDPELCVTGHMDGIIGGEPETPPNSEPSDEFRQALRRAVSDTFGSPPYPLIAQEYKSVNSRGMERMYREGHPYHHQEIQLATYFHLADRNPEQLVTSENLKIEMPEHWQLVCIGKDSWGVLTFGLNGSVKEETLERIQWLNDHWQTQQLAPCECEKWMAKFGLCSYPVLDDGKVVGCCDEALGAQVDWGL